MFVAPNVLNIESAVSKPAGNLIERGFVDVTILVGVTAGAESRSIAVESGSSTLPAYEGVSLALSPLGLGFGSGRDERTALTSSD